MSEPDQLLPAARALRGDLPRLEVEDPESLDRELAELIAAVERGERASSELERMLLADAATREFTRHFLENGIPPGVQVQRTRGLAPPPGIPGRISAVRWSCPGGDFDFFQRSPRERVPPCPTHDLQLGRTA